MWIRVSADSLAGLNVPGERLQRFTHRTIELIGGCRWRVGRVLGLGRRLWQPTLFR
jgi:hypothetical protein